MHSLLRTTTLVTSAGAAVDSGQLKSVRPAKPRMRIAIFDYRVTRTNPIGSCHHRLIQSLCSDFDFTVFAPEFDNPAPERVRFVKIRVPQRPLALLYVAFHIVAPIYYLIERLRHGRFDLVQVCESNLLIRRDVNYTQFCHRRFLREHWPSVKGKGLRSVLRRWDHWLHARLEPAVFSGAKQIVVPSHGMARELVSEYPFVQDKIRVLSNPVDLRAFKRPEEFDRSSQRNLSGASDGDLLMVFVALGHFERKGLPLLLQTMQEIGQQSSQQNLKLLVVGGQNDLLESYRRKVAAMGLATQVKFVGMQQDVRPWLWASDLFVFPSSYETFSLVTFQAAAAGLPIIVTRLHGVEEFSVDGRNSLVVENNPQSVRAGIERFLAMTPECRKAMGMRAQQDVSPFSTERFEQSWRGIYADAGKSC